MSSNTTTTTSGSGGILPPLPTPPSMTSVPPPLSSDTTTNTSTTASSSSTLPSSDSSLPSSISSSPISTPSTPSTSNTTPTDEPSSNPQTLTSSTLPSSTTPPTLVMSTLSVASTSVFQSASIATSDNGQVFTTFIQVTTILAPGSLVSQTAAAGGSSGGTNIGAIVGGVVGGVGGLALILAGIFFCLRRRNPNRNDDFDGDFNPTRVTPGHTGGGGTLPQIDVDDEDDGMSGRLGHGVGGIVTPFTFNPASNEMAHINSTAPLLAGAAGGFAAGHAVDQYGRQISPPTSPIHSQHSSEGPYPATSTTGSSGYHSQNPYAPPTGRGPSPGPTLNTGAPSSSSGHGSALGAGAGVAAGVYNPMSSKEREAYGASRSHVVNPDDIAGLQVPYNGFGEDAHRAYLQDGPQQRLSGYSVGASSAYVVPDPQSTPSGGVIVHQDGGRFEHLTKEEAQHEIPPTYDSIPPEDRR